MIIDIGHQLCGDNFSPVFYDSFVNNFRSYF